MPPPGPAAAEPSDEDILSAAEEDILSAAEEEEEDIWSAADEEFLSAEEEEEEAGPAPVGPPAVPAEPQAEGGPEAAPTAYPPLSMAYEPRCLTVACLWRGKRRPESIATSTTRRALAVQLLAEIETSLAIYADTFVGSALAGNRRVPPLTAAAAGVLKAVFRDAAWRGINALTEHHYTADQPPASRLPPTRDAPCPTPATMSDWLAQHGLQQQLPPLAAAWLVAQTVCCECSHGVPVRDTPMPSEWDPDKVSATRRADAAYVGVTAKQWLAHQRYQRDFHRGLPPSGPQPGASIFEQASLRRNMSLELLAHLLLVVLHQAVEQIADDCAARLRELPDRTLRLRQLVWAVGMAQVSFPSKPLPPKPAPQALKTGAAVAAVPAVANGLAVDGENEAPRGRLPEEDLVFYTDSMEIAQERARLLVSRNWIPPAESGGMAAWSQRMAVIGPDPTTGAIRVWISGPRETADGRPGEWVSILD